MRRVLKISGWILLALLASVAIAWFGFLRPESPPISLQDRSLITMMPLPSELKLGKGHFVLDETMSHEFNKLTTPRLERAVERFYQSASAQTGITFLKGDDEKLIIECSGKEMNYPSFGDDESYSIKISRKKILVKAPSETGIIYGLETLLQLALPRDGYWEFPVVSIKDQPRFGWRGLMIDASRHWIPKEVILRNLDAMTVVKMNVFHWHLTDHQGFRVESKLFPELHEMGSNGDFYSQDDLRDVVEYAADRGIRVIPEFDIPGHTASWFIAHPELASAPGPYILDTGLMAQNPVMDPTREEIYEFLNQFFGEMANIFPDEFMHIGGDEVNPTQWNENPDIQLYMQENDLEDPHDVLAHFNIRLQKLLSNHGKKMMGWDEILHPDLPKESIAIQTWRDHASLWESARHGNMAVLSAGYYLDHKQPASYHYNVDPVVIPGAVDIEIDSNNWKGWDCTLEVANMLIEGALYLFGEGEEQRGILNFMGGSIGFTDITTVENRSSFVVKTSSGDLEFETELYGDSIRGSAKLSVFNLQLKGWRSGGSDMEEGIPLPEYKKIEPLSPDQEANLVGGEACMWSELVNGQTIESRIWPRAASIAEKLWSPKTLTDDVKDMYRRIMVLDDRLERQGLRHRKYSDALLSDMVDDLYFTPLRTLVSVLQEDKMFNRIGIYEPQFYYTTPLDRVVDAALPESFEVYRFGQDVDLWLESGDETAKSRITRMLETWSQNHSKLAPVFDESNRLKEVEAHSINLSKLADFGLEAIFDPASLAERESETKALFESAGEAHGGTILPLTEHVKKLVNSARKN